MGRYYSDGEYWSPAEDEANLMYICRDGRVYEKMIDNSERSSAMSEGFRPTEEGALRASGIIPSKFHKDKWIQKQNGKWVEVNPWS